MRRDANDKKNEARVLDILIVKGKKMEQLAKLLEKEKDKG